MASQRDIKRRIASVQSTKKTTKAMQMVAAARLRRAQLRTERMRPYAENMLEFIGGLVHYLEEDDLSKWPLIEEHEEANTVTLVPLAADRGLCGAFNSNIIRQVNDLVRKYKAEGKEVKIIAVGRKGISTLRFQGHKLHNTYSDIGDRSAFMDAQALCKRIADQYSGHETDRVHLIFNRFVSPMEQVVMDQVVLPIQEELANKYTPSDAIEHMDFIFEPTEKEILDELLPSYLEITVYRAILESMASEHGARMTAMRNASEAAEEMVENLTLEMNRARQFSITQEILEVVAGADALSG